MRLGLAEVRQIIREEIAAATSTVEGLDASTDYKAKVWDAVKSLPKTFGLHEHPSESFRVDPDKSYAGPNGEVVVSVDKEGPSGKWEFFAKGTDEQLRKHVIDDPWKR